MKIVLGADHGGWRMKERVKMWLEDNGYGVKDVGAVEENPDDDYVDYAKLVVGKMKEDGGVRGILFCRNGFGMVITANRFTAVRCGLGFDVRAVEKGRLDDDINCLAIPVDYLDLKKVKEMVKVFLETEFSGKERYKRRLKKINILT